MHLIPNIELLKQSKSKEDFKLPCVENNEKPF